MSRAKAESLLEQESDEQQSSGNKKQDFTRRQEEATHHQLRRTERNIHVKIMKSRIKLFICYKTKNQFTTV
jgi:hypothetical protein